MEHQRKVRDIKDKVTECEIGTREARTESERIIAQMKNEQQDFNTKLDDLGIEKQQTIDARKDFERSCNKQARELNEKLATAK